MELTAIYHRPESEYAYLYKDNTMHIRIRTKKDDIESINLHYGDPFIFIEDRYEAIKEMTKITSDAFDIIFLGPDTDVHCLIIIKIGILRLWSMVNGC